MRGVCVIVAYVGLAFFAAAHAADRSPQTTLLNEYAGYLCAQAALTTPCDSNWPVLVQAGINDIDQRCDSFLAWLDDRRRTAKAASAETDLAAAALAISRASGTGPAPLAAVAAAFGLEGATQINANSQLLAAVDRSTIQTIVFQSRQQFRQEIMKISVADQPAAIDLLRDYLRLCLPATIEASITGQPPGRARPR